MSGLESARTEIVSGSEPWAVGHYPGNPILPGVVQLQWMMDGAQDLGLDFLGGAVVKSVQYLHVVRPGCAVQIRASRDGAKVRATVSVSGEICSKALFEEGGT